MRYAIPGIQIALAIVLALLWLRWNPFAREHDAAEYVPSKRVTASPGEPIEDGPPLIEHDCAMVLGSPSGGPIECIYEPGVPLRLWVVHARVTDAWIGVDGARWTEVSRHTEQSEPGQGLVVDLDATNGEARELSVHLPGQPPWTLRLRGASQLTAQERESHERALVEQLALERELALDKLGGDALVTVEHSIDQIYDRGALGDAVVLVLVASHHLTEKPGRPDLALELVDRYRAHAERYPRGRAAWSIYRGKVLIELGRLAEAAAALREGGRYAVRMRDAGLRMDSLPQYARTLAALGYFEAAAYWGAESLRMTRDAVKAGSGDPADLADVLSVVADANVRLYEMGRTSEDPTRLLEELLGMYSPGGPLEDPRETAVPRLAMAELAMIRDRPAEALRRIDELHELDRRDVGPLNLEQQARAIDIELQALLATSTTPSAALDERLSALEGLAAVVSSPELRWRASIRRGAVLEARGDRAGARAAYERSEELLEELLVLQRLGVGSAVVPERYREGTERLVELLASEGGDQAAALCVARLAQSRSLRLALMTPRTATRSGELVEAVRRYARLARDYEARVRRMPDLSSASYGPALADLHRYERELEQSKLELFLSTDHRGKRPRCEELPRREPKELLLVLHPHEDGLLVLLEDDAGISHYVLTGAASLTRSGHDEWSEATLLAPIAPRLEAASRIRVLAAGPAAAIAVHAMPSRGRLLVERVPVVYGLDLPRHERASPRSADLQASILFDPRVEGAWEEAADVEAALLESGWSVRRTSSAEVSSQGVQAMLSEVDLYHYSGHAYYDSGDVDDPMRHLWPPYPGGAAVEPSYIPLGSTGRIDVSAVLLAERVPCVAFLSACGTGIHDDRMGHGGISLATAFLGAGTEVVVASTHAVDGAEAALLGRGMYASGVSRSTIDDPGTWFMGGVRWAVENGLPREAVRDYRVYVR